MNVNSGGILARIAQRLAAVRVGAIVSPDLNSKIDLVMIFVLPPWHCEQKSISFCCRDNVLIRVI